MSTQDSTRSRTGAALLLGGYGPLVAFVVFFALMAALAPTVAIEDAGASESALGPEGASGQDPQAGSDPAASAPGSAGEASTSTSRGAGDDEGGDAAPGGAADETEGSAPTDGSEGSRAQDAAPSAGAGVHPCEDRDLQVPGDPYSPPCVTFDGDNGGETARGVSADEILISARIPDEPGFQDTLANLSDADISDTPADIRRTFEGLVEYLNERFEFYGRQLRLEFYEGQGSPSDELLGAGREQAQADALTVADEIGAFAEMNAGTEPFGDALSRQGVVNFGVPFVSRQWMAERAPYSWSLNTDCSIVIESTVDYTATRLLHGDATADHAGQGLQGQPRRIATISPDNPWYQECLQDGLALAAEQGGEPAATLNYQLDLNTISNQAANLVAQLQAQDITTVICHCDPVLPVFLTARAQEQDYHPEWVVSGVGFTAQDIIGQLFDQQQWSRAFGISYEAQPRPQQATLGYNAYKQMRDDEPGFQVPLIYYNLYLLAIGIQGAGPQLTPETFEQGMFDYPGGQGPYGTWGFGQTNRTPAEDFREIYWDPEAVSPFNNEQGAYLDVDDRRTRPGELDPGPPHRP